jgi:hypothetical protein
MVRILSFQPRGLGSIPGVGYLCDFYKTNSTFYWIILYII